MNDSEWKPIFYIPKDARSILDVGCNVGEWLESAANTFPLSQIFGVDINRHAIEKASNRLKNVSNVQVRQGSADHLNMDDQSMDAVVCSEVLEHVPEGKRSKVIEEMGRVLRTGGRLILTIPHAGAFQWMDPANFRFRFPSIYRFISGKMGGPGRDQGYEGQANGVVWHHHFSMDEMERLLKEEFRVTQIRFRGSWITPIGDWLAFPYYRLGKYDSIFLRWIKRAQAWDTSKNWGRKWAYNVLIVAIKRSDEELRSTRS